MLDSLWTEKYRPSTLDGYVFRDDAQQAKIRQWIAEGEIPHLLFSGSAGVGKTTLAKIIINNIGVNEYDVLEINASRETSVDVFRTKVTNFVSTMPMGNYKVVLLDEADYLSQHAQASLRGTMEDFAGNARFILTCNYPNKIIPALHSRCQGFHIEKVDLTEFTGRVATILISEGIEFDLDVLDSFVRATYPDLRKTINSLQQNCNNGHLVLPSKGESNSEDWRLEMSALFKAGKIRQARQLVCGRVGPEEYEEIYRWMYDNIDLWGDDESRQDNAVLIIRKGLINHGLVADPEINLAACMIELSKV
jgi:DNA polymerase III delta prime subunit